MQKYAIRRAFAQFLSELASADRRWLRVESVADATVLLRDTTEAVPSPLQSLSDVLGVSGEEANTFLRVAGLLANKKNMDVMIPIRAEWESLASEFSLDIEIGRSSLGGTGAVAAPWEEPAQGFLFKNWEP